MDGTNDAAAARSMCAVHFQVESVQTCRRCGRFACASCLPDLGDFCTECVARMKAEVPPLETRALLAMLGLGATAFFHLAMGAVAALRLAKSDFDEESGLSLAYGLAALGYLPTMLTTVVLVAMWFHRAARHALARGANLEVQSPAAAVGAWFIPFLNLVRPFNITRQMLGNAGKDSGVVALWQATWILGNIAANLSTRMSNASEYTFSVISDVLLIGAAIAAITVVRTLKWS